MTFWVAPTTRCRSETCNELLVWARAARGPMPVNATPHPRGNLILSHRDGTGPLVARFATATDPPGPRYVSHFMTCPDAHLWRKPR